MKDVLEIGNAQGFWGDQVDAPARLVIQHPSLDFLTLDYLSEVSMSIMAIQREKDPTKGYAKDFVDVVRSLVPLWKSGIKTKVVCNAGGLNPKSCGEACVVLLKQMGCDKKVAIITGDDVLPLIQKNPNSAEFYHLESDQSIKAVVNELQTANAYLGAREIVEALKKGADIVITGRVTDPSLTVGPCVAHFGWGWDDYNRLAGATVAGHLIECGTQVTGGISTEWLNLKYQENLGFPIVEVDAHGSCVVTKPKNTSGIVNERTVKEQLLYEIGDPARYMSPDVITSFLTLKVEGCGKDRVRVSGATGVAPPETYKVSATYRDGYKSEATLALFGREIVEKARQCGEIILAKLERLGCKPQRSCVECVGDSAVVPGVFNSVPFECMLRVAVADPNESVVERFTKEIAPLVTSGPQGTTGYISGRPKVRQVFAYWPCLVKKTSLKPIVEVV